METKIGIRREIIRLIRHMPPEKLKIIIKTIKELDEEELTPEDIAAIQEGEESVAKGETISLEEFCRREGI